MSVFRGSIAEYPGVIVDHFISANCERGRVFFLSHCHKDHMTGLSSSAILNALQRYRTHLYCSEVTCSLLLKDPDFTQLSPYLKGLPMDEPVSMTLEACGLLSEKLNFTVTLLPAGHCPGSSMFFFQGCKGNVLYTGDFRLTLDETKRLRALHCGESLLGITTLYVDTTFCHPIATDIPSRETSRDLILKLIESWLAKSPANVVHLQCAMFGYEHLYMGVHKKFKCKIHIAAWRINAYREISAVTDCLTTDGESTRIHACNFRRGQKRRPGLPCGSCERGGIPNVLRVKPSTQWFLFNKRTTSQPCVFLPQLNMFRVIHSMHASYSELQQFVTYIRPKRIVPCVVPFGDSSLMDVCTRLKGFLPLTEVASTCPEPKPTCSVSRLTVGSSAKSAGNAASTSISTESDDDAWSTGDESISEFTNTEDQLSAENTTFFHYHNQEHQADIVALPSLLSIKTTEASPPPSTDSATVGSLKQSPIDLSLGSPSSGSASQTTQTDILPTTGTKLGSTEDEEKTESSLLSCGNDKEVPDQVAERVSDDRVEDVVGAVDSEVGVAVKGRTDDWCLQYDCSPADTSVVNTPPAKRVRLSETTNSVSRKLFSSKSTETEQRQVETSRTGKYEASGAHHAFIDLTEDEETSELTASSDGVHVCPPPQMIDLTHDHQAPSDLTHDHRAPSNLTHDHQVPSDLTHDHRAPSDLTRDYQVPSDLTHDHRVPLDLTRDYQVPSDLTHDHHAPSDVTRDYQVPSDLTHDHRAPSDLTRDYQVPSDLTHDHHAPSDVTRDYQVPSELQYFLVGRTRKLADCASSNPALTAPSNAVQTSSRSMPPVVIELSDSQSTGSTVGRRSASVESGSHDPFGSPGYLPPTPGRENVTSILQRQDFP